MVNPGHPSASDGNPGTSDQPLKTLAKAASSAKPGDQVVVAGGTYSEALAITTSGLPGKRIVFKPVPGETVVLDGGCVEIESQSHIEVRNFTIKNCLGGDSPQRGIYLEGPSMTDIVIDGNHIINTRSSAISVWGVPYRSNPGDYRNITNLKITNNIIEQANNGGHNEQITVANGVTNFEIAGNTLRNSHNTVNGGEGIDIKEGASYGTIHHNTIYDIDRRAIYLDGGGRDGYMGAVHHIEIYGNVAYDVPNGFAIMSEGGSAVHDIKVYNNLFYNIDYDCMFVYDHPATASNPSVGKFWNLSFVNNTLYNCGTVESHRASIDMNSDKATGVLIRNNIAYPRRIRAGSAETVDHNLFTDPMVVSPGSDFTLRAGSPAIDTGSSSSAPSVDRLGRSRPLGGGVDIGAHER